MKDLVVLVADKNMQATLRGALARPQALEIRPISFDFRVHPGRDGGARTSGPAVLATERRRFSHALLVLDLEGSGSNTIDPVEVERELDARLGVQWEDRAKSVVIAPELDVWLWGADNALRDVFRWPLQGSIREWLLAEGFELDAAGKPARPKEAFEAMVRVHRQARSSALYEKVAAKISLKRCHDAAFVRLRTQLQRWFGS
jgi:hypothetical protein